MSGADGSKIFTITDGLYSGSKTATANDTDLTAANIKNTVEIFGVTGTYTGGGSSAAVPETGQTTQYDTNTPQADDGGTDPPGSALPTPRFTDNGDGSVTDNLTGLIWLQNADCAATTAAWQSALDYVVELNDTATMNTNSCGYTGSQTDWRLPTMRELHSLVHVGYTGPALSNDAGNAKWANDTSSSFTNVKSNYYWSSTSYSDGTALAWRVAMSYGYVGNGHKTTADYYVWPVRGGQ